MRVAKTTGGVTTRYCHDGQMGFEDLEMAGSTTTVTRYGLGARGIDFMERTMGSTVTAGFPLYDAHGNMVATLARSGTNSYAVNDRRSYDAWGVVRYSQSTGDPKQRYCASLGHRADDETLLTYMRARYYDAASGRFISEDTNRRGGNWFAYCSNNPVGRADQSGKTDLSDAELAEMVRELANALQYSMSAAVVATAGVEFCQAWLFKEMVSAPIRDPDLIRKQAWLIDFEDTIAEANPGFGSVQDQARSVAFTYALMLRLCLWVTDDPDL